MISGEEVVARLVEQEGVTVFVNPLALGMGEQGLGLMPWLLGKKNQEVVVNAGHIVASAPANTDLENTYIEATSGISIKA